MADEAAAFAPGHVTGFFEIHDEAADPAQMGSRGAGFSVALGVESRVRLRREGVPGVTVTAGGRPVEGATTRRAVELLAGDEPIHVEVEQRMDLPVSQGFGMSAAGALSAALALGSLLGRSRRESVWAAHCAEVFQRTGLGDVVGSSAGGFEVRVRPGCEPYGEVRHWRPEAPVADVLLAVVSPAVLTKRVLGDPKRRASIQALGGALVDAFLEDPTLARFVAASHQFATESRLATPEIHRLWDEAGDRAGLGQCQLGGSVFAFGAPRELERRLRGMGDVFRTTVDEKGARLVQTGKGP